MNSLLTYIAAFVSFITGTTPNIALVFDAIEQNDIAIVEQLLKKEVNINMQYNYGCTPLYYACNDCNIDIVKLLLEHGAKLDIPNVNYWTPLHIACYRNNLEIVKLLLKHGADTNIQSCDGCTPLFFTNYLDNPHDIIINLIEYGSNCNLIDNYGNTVFDSKYGNFIREYLESKEHDILLK